MPRRLLMPRGPTVSKVADEDISSANTCQRQPAERRCARECPCNSDAPLPIDSDAVSGVIPAASRPHRPDWAAVGSIFGDENVLATGAHQGSASNTNSALKEAGRENTSTIIRRDTVDFGVVWSTNEPDPKRGS
jgi:hypothetical protein